MCGIAGIFGPSRQSEELGAMVAAQRHRGPDADGLYIGPSGIWGLGHNRLSIIDLSEAGRQPMSTPDGRFLLIFNGEVYNYRELRTELTDYPYRTRTDSEVVLAAYLRWGEACLDRFVGMFAFAIWDTREQSLFAARDRFGVKPLYYHQRPDGTLLLASEIKALHAAGVPAEPDRATWAAYLVRGHYSHSGGTFWKGICALPAGHRLTWSRGNLSVSRWYDLYARVGGEWDSRSIEAIEEEYQDLMLDSVRLRFRSDVPVGINLSGGLDSSTLLGLVQKSQGPHSDVKAFTFVTGDPAYDELPWVRQMLARTHHPSVVCRLEVDEVPALAASVHAHQDEPFGGLPTLAYARLFETARAEGVIVLLDANGLDEQWAGYDYYAEHVFPGQSASGRTVQGTSESPVRPDCLVPEFREMAESDDIEKPFPDALRNLQYRDILYTKLPRALRFNDRVSMRSSTELREPFLDHRLFELALRQKTELKIVGGTHKWLLRRMARQLLPDGVVEAPKRAMQTPQREWLRKPLKGWANELIEDALYAYGGTWLDSDKARKRWHLFLDGEGDNSFFVWQWISLGMLAGRLVH